MKRQLSQGIKLVLLVSVIVGVVYILMPYMQSAHIEKVPIKKVEPQKVTSKEENNVNTSASVSSRFRIIREEAYQFKNNNWANYHKTEYSYFPQSTRKSGDITWFWENNRWTAKLKNEFQYFANDSLQLWKHYFFKNGEMVYLCRYFYEYNSENKLREMKISYNGEDSFKKNAIYDYEHIKDINGSICILKITTYDGTKIADTTYFDMIGRKVESRNSYISIVGDAPKRSYYRRTFNYDNLGRLCLEVLCEGRGNKVTNHWQCSFLYDQSGLLVSKLYNFINDGAVVGKIRKRYLYDNNKNNIEEISEDWDGKNYVLSGKNVRTYESYNNPS